MFKTQFLTLVENERSNLLALMRLVLNSLLDDQIRRTRILDLVESQVISDFFIIFEKCLWHGFKVPGFFFNFKTSNVV